MNPVQFIRRELLMCLVSSNREMTKFDGKNIKCVCVCVCVCIYIYIYIYVCVCVCVCVCIHTLM